MGHHSAHNDFPDRCIAQFGEQRGFKKTIGSMFDNYIFIFNGCNFRMYLSTPGAWEKKSRTGSYGMMLNMKNRQMFLPEILKNKPGVHHGFRAVYKGIGTSCEIVVLKINKE
jgi:hypothetical protein